MTDAAPAPFALLGDPTAAACEADACLIPVASDPSAESHPA
jgi:hypothetical protein